MIFKRAVLTLYLLSAGPSAFATKTGDKSTPVPRQTLKHVTQGSSPTKGGRRMKTVYEGSGSNINETVPETVPERANVHGGRDLRDLLFSGKMLKQTKILDLSSNDELKSGFERVARDALYPLRYSDSDTEVKEAHKEFRRAINVRLEELGKKDMTNMGDELSDDTILLMILHYATDAEKENELDSDGLNKMGKSPCVDFARLHLGGSHIREYAREVLDMDEETARKVWDEEWKGQMCKAVTTIDYRPIISVDKDDYQKELKELAQKDNTTVQMLNLIGVMNAAFHILYYNLRTKCEKSPEGEKLSVLCFSTYVWDDAFDRMDTTGTELANFIGYLAHPEVWIGGYIANKLLYDGEMLRDFDRTVGLAFAGILAVILNIEEPFCGFVETKIAERFAGGELTQDEEDARRELLLQSRIKGGTTFGYMRTYVSGLIKELISERDVSVEEAIRLLPAAVEQIASDYGKVKEMNTKMIGAIGQYHDLIQHQPKAAKDLPKLSQMMRNIHLGERKRDMRFMLARAMGVYQVTNGVVEWNDAESLIVEVSALLARLLTEVTESGKTATIPHIATLVTEVVGQKSVEETVKSLSNRELKDIATFVKHTREMATKLESKDTKILLKSDCNKEGLCTNGWYYDTMLGDGRAQWRYDILTHYIPDVELSAAKIQKYRSDVVDEQMKPRPKGDIAILQDCGGSSSSSDEDD